MKPGQQFCNSHRTFRDLDEATLAGTNLTGTTLVRIGTFAVTNFAVVNATTLTFAVPNGASSMNSLITIAQHVF